MKTYEQMSEDVFSRIEECKKEKIRRRRKILKNALTVSSVAVLTVCGLWYSGILGRIFSPVLTDFWKSSVNDNLNGVDKDENIVSKFSTLKSGSYSVPEPGEYGFTVAVREARKHYDYSFEVQYLLKLDVFSADGKIIEETETFGEYKRLAMKGYSFYNVTYWDYSGENGEKTEHQTILGLFTEAQLQNFDVNENYGYMFSFVTNGDYSPVNLNEGNTVAYFASDAE